MNTALQTKIGTMQAAIRQEATDTLLDSAVMLRALRCKEEARLSFALVMDELECRLAPADFARFDASLDLK